MLTSLHTNDSKKQHCKFAQSVAKICNQFSVFGYIYNLWMKQRWDREIGDGRCIQNLVRKPQGKLSVQRCNMAGMIKLRWVLT